MRLATRLAPIELEDAESGERVRLGTLFSRRPTVLVFLRHFG
ncbi:MAG TPA: hypothetical protein PLW10_20680 [Myxococcota bacterium]|nr:hypothetical protein [Myxococcota bacterium]